MCVCVCVLQAQGVCVENAVTPPGEHSQLPSMLCGEDGQWVGQPTSSCACRPGYEARDTDVRCQGESFQNKSLDLLRLESDMNLLNVLNSSGHHVFYKVKASSV